MKQGVHMRRQEVLGYRRLRVSQGYAYEDTLPGSFSAAAFCDAVNGYQIETYHPKAACSSISSFKFVSTGWWQEMVAARMVAVAGGQDRATAAT
jgi:hypothetical protein